MNKSLALKNKLYLFFLLVISLFIFIYLLYFLINGPRGMISYFKLKNDNQENKIILNELVKRNDFFYDKINRLKANSLDLDFLDEKVREKTGYIDNDEILIIFN